MRKKRNSLSILLVILIFITSSCSLEPDLRIFAVARNEGHLDGCGCPSAPAGGIARRIAEIEKRTGTLNKPNLLNFDTGGFSNLLSEEGRIQTLALMEIFDKVNMTAVNVSTRELTGDGELFLSAIQRASTPYISANIIETVSEKPFFQPFIIKKISGKQVAILGITAASENLWDCSGTTLKTIDPATAINQTLAGLDQKPDFTILLAHIPKRNLEDLLINVKGIDLVLGADGYSLTREVININGTTICYPGKQGQFMCDMSFTSTSNSFEFRQMEMIRLTGEMAENREIRKIVDRALDSVDKLKSKTETD